MLVSIKDIKVKKRVRKDLGNLENLKDSLRRYGLLNPITLNSKYLLIAGERRLEAAKAIGWTSINANIIDNLTPLSQLEMELEENNQRKEFTDEELLEGYKRLARLRNPSPLRRLWDALVAFFVWLFKTIASWFGK
ncbi:MAG: ParB N-terminal domain-containing protein [Treponema sp.]|nr:ParB N-terminal domain-containing protein [Treponema sp.]MEE3434742.1 ParB N-terminal domain-containing protein [Treponema sp.]